MRAEGRGGSAVHVISVVSRACAGARAGAVSRATRFKHIAWARGVVYSQKETAACKKPRERDSASRSARSLWSRFFAFSPCVHGALSLIMCAKRRGVLRTRTLPRTPRKSRTPRVYSYIVCVQMCVRTGGGARGLGGGTAPSSPQTLRPERCEIGAVWDGKGRSAQHPLHK